MGKNWLIRTKSNHILGPVSKEKVVELFQNGSIKQDDEICSGNGYWFFIRESDLVDRYLLGDEIQTFNPISEAKDVLTSSGSGGGGEPTRDDITMIGGIDLKQVMEIPQVKEAQTASVTKSATPEEAQKKKLRSEIQPKQSETPKKQPKQNYFKYLAVFIFVILVMIIYFRKTILRSFLSSEIHYKNIPSLFLAEAQAQDDGSAKKKSY
jgi:hypothetical protein